MKKDECERNAKGKKDYRIDGMVSKEVLENYLARSVTLSGEQGEFQNVGRFILNTGAKYVCRAATCWSPSAEDDTVNRRLRAVIDEIHETDVDVVFEACIFENITKSGVESIAVPAWVFEAFGKPCENRRFRFDAMCFPDGKYLGQWGAGTAVPDITQEETMLFFYYRACNYVNYGFEALHMGQIKLIGERDEGWGNYTKLIGMIRAYAKEHARRRFVFFNAHTAGIVGSDGKLLLDFPMYPARFITDTTQTAHAPTAENPQYAYLKNGYSDSIYGKSIGGTTYSGWHCDSMPYLVEIDNFSYAPDLLNKPVNDGYHVWGMDEISWFANQSTEQRKEILRYSYYWMRYYAEGNGYFAMPGQRVAFTYDEKGNQTMKNYYAYDTEYYAGGWGDESVIKALWAGELALSKDSPLFFRDRADFRAERKK